MAKRVKKAEYYIELKDGTKVPVTEEVYYAYKTPAWKEAKKAKKRGKIECSYEVLVENGLEGKVDPLKKLASGLSSDVTMIKLLNEAINELNTDDRKLIYEYFFKGKSERTLAFEYGISQKGINKRKTKILNLLKNYINNNI